MANRTYVVIRHSKIGLKFITKVRASSPKAAIAKYVGSKEKLKNPVMRAFMRDRTFEGVRYEAELLRKKK